MNWVGIDPGQTGGLALVDSSGDLLAAEPMPATAGEVDAVALYELLSHWAAYYDNIRVVIEQVHAMPKQGVSSTFKFGKNFGIALGVVAAFGVPLHRVTPQAWKKTFTLIGKDKDASRGQATELWPDMAHRWRFKNATGLPDAALIAEHARRTLSHPDVRLVV